MAITNLTNTTWYFNETLDHCGISNETPEHMGAMGELFHSVFNINFTSNNKQYTMFEYELGDPVGLGVLYHTENVDIAYHLSGVEGWEDEVYRTITIIGGEDATNPDLITWIISNAYQPLDTSGVKINYNNSTIASLRPGEIATLQCVDQSMCSNIIVEVPDTVNDKNLKKFDGAVDECIQANYLTFSSPAKFTLRTYNGRKNWDGILEYSIDTNTWSVWDGTTTLSADDGKLYLRGTNNTKISPDPELMNSYNWVLSGMYIACDGNIETLLDYMTVANGQHPFMDDCCFLYLFSDCVSLIKAPTLPAISLSKYCYRGLFSDCSSLVEAPALPATTLASGCYWSMFWGCTSLVKAPALPATTLADDCYYSMFRDCTNLITVPALPATTLADYCYERMFNDCTNIKISTTQTEEYCNEYRIPASGNGTSTSGNALINMFANTSGTFTGNPNINTTYYTANEVVYYNPEATEPTASITYNNETIATLEAGQTATIKAAEYEFDHDLVFKVGSGGGGNTEPLDIPTRTLTYEVSGISETVTLRYATVENNTLIEKTVDAANNTSGSITLVPMAGLYVEAAPAQDSWSGEEIYPSITIPDSSFYVSMGADWSLWFIPSQDLEWIEHLDITTEG